MSTRKPPRFVPTLTEVVRGGEAAAGTPRPEEEQLVQRVLQKVDVTLERRVREAIATVVLEQTAALMPLLRQEIERAVRETVAQALAEEIERAK